MDYIGSKCKLTSWIFNIIKASFKNGLFLDACSGSGVISRYAAAQGYEVIANDIMAFPKIIVNGSIGLTPQQKLQAHSEIDRINALSGRPGYFYINFCEESSVQRLYFTAANAKLIDMARAEIDGIASPKVRDYLLYCGLEALSRVSNTTGVQAAFLKKFKSRAMEQFALRPEEVVDGTATAFQCDILTLLKDSDFRTKYREDVLYIDPPYNHRQYGPNYHLYETFVRNDNPKAHGKTGLRNWKSESSDFCTKKTCLQFLKNVISASVAQVVYMSYNSDGLLTASEICSAFPNAKVHQLEQTRYKADSSIERNYNPNPLFEYLFEIPR